MIVMQKFPQVFSTEHQSKFLQLQLEVAALEQQMGNLLQKRWEQTKDRHSHSPIPLVYVSDRTAKTGIKLAHDTSS